MTNQLEAYDISAVYRERAFLVAHLASIYPAFKTPALDLGDDGKGWWLVFVYPGGMFDGHQTSWHISPEDADLIEQLPEVAPPDWRVTWDQHDTGEKYGRLHRLTQHRFAQK